MNDNIVSKLQIKYGFDTVTLSTVTILGEPTSMQETHRMRYSHYPYDIEGHKQWQPLEVIARGKAVAIFNELYK